MTAPAQNPPVAPQAMAAFADPAAVGGTRPAIRDMVGRTVVIRATRYEPNAPAIKAGETQPRITADVLVVNGGPMEFGGNMVTKNIPNTLRVQTPYLVTGMYISNKNIVEAIRDKVGAAPVLGRVVEGQTNTPGNNNPYNLLTVDQAAPEFQMAAGVYTQVLNGVFVNPESQPIAGPAPVAYPAAAPVVQAAAPQDPAAAFQAWLASQQQAAPVAAPSIPPAPANWQPDVWAGLTDAQRAQVLQGAPF